ncbi:multidrug ABC transporter ATP-binding protein [Halobacteriales archaeon QS_8_69_26]|nr:MAG: multidrug ABC transporter ATP-binding protein [Halobacteriales archaeon QS_8_69_26]
MSGAGADEDDEFADIRKEEGNAIWRLFRDYGRAQAPQFVMGASASVLRMTMELVPSLVLAIAIDSLFFDTQGFSLWVVPRSWLPAEQSEQFLLVGGLIVGAYALNSVLGWFNSYMWNSFSQHFQHEVRVDTYDAMQRRETDFFDNKQTGEVMSVLNNDVNQLEEFLTTNLNNLIVILVRVGGMGAVMLWINWRLAMFPVLIIPALGYVSYKFVDVIHPKYQEVRSSVGQLNSRLENNVGGIETVKAFATEQFETGRVEEASEGYLDAQWDAITTRILYFPTLQAITAAGYVSVFFVGGWWLVVGSPPHSFFAGPTFSGRAWTAGTLVLFLNYTRRFVYPMRQMGQIINGYQYAEAAGERIVGLLDMESRVKDDPDAPVLEDPDGHVAFDDVSFAYEDREGHSPSGSRAEPGDAEGEPDDQVLQDVSFEADPGDYVGLVGPTGAGKSTTMKLLLRFYDPDEGAVRVDGTDVRDVSLRSLRESVGYVSQEPYLFYGTVTENIAYGLPDADEDEVRAAAELAGAHEFVADLSDGYDTMVGERGVKLSGGQRQRIALARAILRDPEILVLDEATSHVDNETEAVIQNSLEDLIEDRTTFAIAHRLSTVRDADEILVMDDGRIVESGTHEELLDEDGLYANLWDVQLGEVGDLPDEFLERAARSGVRAPGND